MGEAERKRTTVRLTNPLGGLPIVHIIDAPSLARMGDLAIDVQDVRPVRPIHFEIPFAADDVLLTFINPTPDFIDGLEASSVQVSAPIQADGAAMRLGF